MIRTVLIYCMVFFLLTAAASAQSGIAVNEESAVVYREGLSLFNGRKYGEAVAKFKESYALDNRNLNALFAQGLAENRAGDNTAASATFSAVLEIEPTHEKALKMLPTALTEAGEFEAAFAAYDRGMAAMPDSAYFYLGKAVAYLKEEQYKDAIPLLSKASELEQKNADILVRLMFAYREFGDMAKATDTAKKVLALDGGHAQARVIVADYFRENERYEDALAEYELASRNIETKAYAEHYIEQINQTLEELEIEREYQARQEAAGNGG